jgi:hypothetical protein
MPAATNPLAGLTNAQLAQYAASLGVNADMSKATPDATGGYNPNSPIAKSDSDAITEATKSVIQQQKMAAAAQGFMKAQGQLATGPAYADTPVNLMGFHGSIPSLARLYNNVADPDKAAAIKNLSNINAANWAQMRPPGSGPIRTTEAESWKQAFPGPTNWGTDNQAIANRLQSEADSGLSQLQFATRFVHSGQGSYADALTAWNKQQGQQGGQPGQQPGNPRAQTNAALKAKSASAQQQNDPVNLFGN